MTTCQAIGCKASVQPGHSMCRLHWFMVPKFIRKLGWRGLAQARQAIWGLEHEVKIILTVTLP